MQTFELTVRLNSRIASEKQIRDSAGPPMPHLFQVLMNGTTAIISVKHVDYNVARTLVDTADRWLLSSPYTDDGKLTKFLKRNSHWIPRIFQYGIGTIAAFTVWHEIPRYLNNSSGPHELATFAVGSLFITYALYRCAFHLGRTAEDSVDMHRELSYIKLTRGDDNEVANAETRKSANWKHGIIAFSAAVLEAAFAKFVVAACLAVFASR